MRKQVLYSLIAATAILASGCASKPTELQASYVSPYKYKDYECDQIMMEMDHVSHRTVDLYYSLDKKASDDAAQMGVGLILFWPALFMLEGGDGPEAAEYSQLKGDFDALRTVSVQKRCELDMMPRSPEEIIAEKAEEEKLAEDTTETTNGVH